MIDYAAILTRRYQGKLWTLERDTYEGLTWISKGKAPTQDELDALWPSVQQEIENEHIAKLAARQTILDRLGITKDEFQTLIN